MIYRFYGGFLLFGGTVIINIMINPTPTATWALAHPWKERVSYRSGGKKTGESISCPARVVFQSCHSGKVWQLPLVTACSLEKGARSLGKAPSCPQSKPTNPQRPTLLVAQVVCWKESRSHCLMFSAFLTFFRLSLSFPSKAKPFGPSLIALTLGFQLF